MIEHELLIVTIETMWPNLVHGQDYLVAHPIDNATGAHAGDAYIMRWSAKNIAEPDIAFLLSQCESNRPALNGRKALVTRSTLLSQTDWTQVPDAPLTADQVAAYKTYRTALRDITKQPGYPSAIEWPVAPA